MLPGSAEESVNISPAIRSYGIEGLIDNSDRQLRFPRQGIRSPCRDIELYHFARCINRLVRRDLQIKLVRLRGDPQRGGPGVKTAGLNCNCGNEDVRRHILSHGQFNDLDSPFQGDDLSAVDFPSLDCQEKRNSRCRAFDNQSCRIAWPVGFFLHFNSQFTERGLPGIALLPDPDPTLTGRFQPPLVSRRSGHTPVA
ncbi:MAG: hypothetical protein A4E66_02381 [Syntrophus sp. PtaB.Bin001]|nr:MAG: hypothetical protein A4E66_02381 [Syntrophus sp. PtaB.Bin001]